MVKRRKYGDAWKDVQIDAEQNDAVFDRFFKRTQPETADPLAREEKAVPPASAGKGVESPSVRRNASSTARANKPDQSKTPVRAITPALPHISDVTHISGRVDRIKRQYRLSKGEASVLKHLLEKTRENGGTECYAKIPLLADACEMTHRGCQFALRSLETRGFVIRLKDYDPTDRLGIKFQISLPNI
jgi:hypothetical protein